MLYVVNWYAIDFFMENTNAYLLYKEALFNKESNGTCTWHFEIELWQH